MADEITASASLKFTQGSVSESASFPGIQIDMTGTDYLRGTQQVGASEEAFNAGADLTTLGYIIVKNNNTGDPDVNYVEWFGNTGETATIRIPAGGIALFRLGSASPFVKATGAICQIEYLILEQ